MATIPTSKMPEYALIVASLVFFAGLPAYGQVPVDENGSPLATLDNTGDDSFNDSYETDGDALTPAELETLVGPIALYPDDLLAVVLPAATYPLQIVQAARFLEAYETDNTLTPDESWDESVVALINYPEVIHLLNDDIDWTWELGGAFISQQPEIITAVESFRDRAYAAGNLKSDEHQTVTKYADIIEIEPIEDDVIYVPYYEPERVVTYQPRRVYYYYDSPRAVYYYPYPSGYAFSSGFFWGVTTAFHIGWASNNLFVYHPSYWGHPYYGHSYSGHNYRRPSITAHNTFYVNNSRRYSPQHFRDGDYWRPRRHAGARQSDHRSGAHYYSSNAGQRHSSENRRRQQRNHGNHQRDGRSRQRSQNEIRFRPREATGFVPSEARNTENRRKHHSRNRLPAQRQVNRASSRQGREQLARNQRTVSPRQRPEQNVQHQSRRQLQARSENVSPRRQPQAGNEQRQSRRQLQARNVRAQSRPQQPARVALSSRQQPTSSREVSRRHTRNETTPTRKNKSEHRQQPIKEYRAATHKREKNEKQARAERHSAGKNEQLIRASGKNRKERSSGRRRERQNRASR